MGIQLKGPFGGFFRKTGGLVGTMKKVRNIITSVPTPSSKAPAKKQTDQRFKFGIIIHLLSYINDLIAIGFGEHKVSGSAMNAAVAYHLKYAVTLLAGYTLDVNEDYRQLLKLETIAAYNQLTEDSRVQEKEVELQLTEIDKKIRRLRDRHATEDIDREMYEEYKAKFQEERVAITEKLAQGGNRVSNLEKCVDEIINYASKLATTWALGGYAEKQKLQFSIFPEGILYNRKNDECRTPRVNEVFRRMADVVRNLGEKENGNNTFNCTVPAKVEREGEISNFLEDFDMLNNALNNLSG